MIAGAANDMPMLKLDRVDLRFGGLRAIADVSFSVTSGDVVGLIGPNGAGKTSLLNCVTGFYRPTSGSILLDGKPIDALGTARIAALGVARTFQNSGNIQGMGVRDVMLIGRDRFLPYGVLRYMLPLPGLRAAERAAADMVREVAVQLGIDEYVVRNVPFESLPYGVRKRADLGRALVAESRLILLDEPGAGLTKQEKWAMGEVILEVSRRSAVTLVVVDHDVDFVASLCKRLVVLNGGRLIADGATSVVLANAAVIESYVGRTAVPS